MTAKTWRQLLVYLHVASSVSWMSQAAAHAVLFGVAAGDGPQEFRLGAILASKMLDDTLLVYSANIAAATGLLLAAATSWGFWVHRWVAIKLVATIGQLYVGIFILGDVLDDAVVAVRAGQTGPTGTLTVASVLMTSAFATQVWISIAKPGGKTRRGRSVVRPPAAGRTVLACATLAPVADTVLGLILRNPTPVFSLVLLAVLLVRRSWVAPKAGRITGEKGPIRGSRPAATAAR